MATTNSQAQHGKATTVKKAFSRTTSVQIDIQADASIIWVLLTNASDFPRWNSTVVSLEGDIEQGKKIRLKSTLDPKREFKLKVKELIPEKRMVWGDGKGNRTYLLEKINESTIRFSMSEKIGGVFFPLYAKFIPPFDEPFSQFAADLKKEAEIIQD